MTDTTKCPLCGASNDCGIAAGKSTCWCFSASVPPEVLERIPDDARGSACVCAKCAGQAAADVTTPPSAGQAGPSD